MSKITKAIVRELKEIGYVTLYFLIAFGLILLLKKLFLAEYGIELYPVAQVIIGALVVAKVVVILNHTSLSKRFQDSPPYLNILYRSGLYTLGVALAGILERMFHMRHEAGSVQEAFLMVVAGRDTHHFVATIICIGLAFVGFNLLEFLNEHMGKGGLPRLLFGKIPARKRR